MQLNNFLPCFIRLNHIYFRESFAPLEKVTSTKRDYIHHNYKKFQELNPDHLVKSI